MALIKKIYSPLKARLSMITIDSQSTQDYDVDTDTFSPDRRIVPTVIQPIIYIYDPAGLVKEITPGDGGQKNIELSSDAIDWYLNEVTEGNKIQSGTDFTIDKTSDTQNKGRITIRKNTPLEKPLTLVFQGTYYDKVGDKVRRKVPFQGSVTLASNIAAKSPLVLQKHYPLGRIFNPVKHHNKLSMAADLYNGQKVIPAAYWWYKVTTDDMGVETKTLITETNPTHKSRELVIPISEKVGAVTNTLIERENFYFVEVQDCRSDLEALRDIYASENSEKDPEVLEQELAALTLPEGYRPKDEEKDESKIITADFVLGVRYPTYTWKVVTDFGDDSEIITIPSHIETFNAWIEFHTPAGIIDPEIASLYWDFDWKIGGKTKIKENFNMSLIEEEMYSMEPKVTEKIR